MNNNFVGRTLTLVTLAAAISGIAMPAHADSCRDSGRDQRDYSTYGTRSDDARFVLTNDTDGAVRVHLDGRSDEHITLEPGERRVVTVEPGRYEVRAHSGDTEFKTACYRLDDGDRQAVRFVERRHCD
jgi:hypothetical protein